MAETTKSCPCKRINCERHGDCEACLAHHKRTGKQTSCQRLKAKEQKKLNNKGNG